MAKPFPMVLNRDDLLRVIRMQRDGATQVKIAAALGITDRTLRKMLKAQAGDLEELKASYTEPSEQQHREAMLRDAAADLFAKAKDATPAAAAECFAEGRRCLEAADKLRLGAHAAAEQQQPMPYQEVDWGTDPWDGEEEGAPRPAADDSAPDNQWEEEPLELAEPYQEEPAPKSVKQPKPQPKLNPVPRPKPKKVDDQAALDLRAARFYLNRWTTWARRLMTKGWQEREASYIRARDIGPDVDPYWIAACDLRVTNERAWADGLEERIYGTPKGSREWMLAKQLMLTPDRAQSYVHLHRYTLDPRTTRICGRPLNLIEAREILAEE